MSNKTQLQTNNTALDALIARVNAAKDTAASLPEAGGGSVETCTVTVGVTTGSSVYCTYTKCENGTITYETMAPSLTFGTVDYAYCDYFVLTNVVCNSTVFVQQDDSGTESLYNNAELLQSWNSGRYFVFRPSADGYIVMYE